MAKKKIWTAEDVEYLQIIAQDVVSLETPIGSDEEGENAVLGDFIADTAPLPEEVSASKDRKRLLRRIMSQVLSPREEIVIRMRYGFEDDIFLTLEEVGSHFGVTRERIRQIEAKAIKKLREEFTKRNIKMEDLL